MAPKCRKKTNSGTPLRSHDAKTKNNIGRACTTGEDRSAPGKHPHIAVVPQHQTISHTNGKKWQSNQQYSVHQGPPPYNRNTGTRVVHTRQEKKKAPTFGAAKTHNLLRSVCVARLYELMQKGLFLANVDTKTSYTAPEARKTGLDKYYSHIHLTQ